MLDQVVSSFFSALFIHSLYSTFFLFHHSHCKQARLIVSIHLPSQRQNDHRERSQPRKDCRLIDSMLLSQVFFFWKYLLFSHRNLQFPCRRSAAKRKNAQAKIGFRLLFFSLLFSLSSCAAAGRSSKSSLLHQKKKTEEKEERKCSSLFVVLGILFNVGSARLYIFSPFSNSPCLNSVIMLFSIDFFRKKSQSSDLVRLLLEKLAPIDDKFRVPDRLTVDVSVAAVYTWNSRLSITMCVHEQRIKVKIYVKLGHHHRHRHSWESPDIEAP